MGYNIKFNFLLRFDPRFDIAKVTEGARFTYVASGERLFPLNIPIDACDSEAQFIGKVAIRKLILERGQTTVDCEVLKVFTPAEAKVYSETFIPAEAAN